MKLTSKTIEYSVPTVGDLPTTGVEENQTIVVTDEDRGGVFIARDSGEPNEGTIFNGGSLNWHRQYDGAVNVKWFGAKGDGSTDNKNAYSKIETFTATKPGVNLIFEEGIYFSSSTFVLTGVNTSCIGVGKVTLINNLSEVVNISGYKNIIRDSITVTIPVDTSTIPVSNTSGLSAGDMICIYSGKSSISTPDVNIVPTKKEWLTINKVNTDTIELSSGTTHEHLLNDDGYICYHNSNISSFAINNRLENIQIQNDSSYNGAYAFRVDFSYGTLINLVDFNLYSAWGFVGYSDLATIQNTTLVSYGGFSCARGTGSLKIDNCNIKPRSGSNQDLGVFVEEESTSVSILNSTIEGSVNFSSAPDTDFTKYTVSNCTISTSTRSPIVVSGTKGKVTIDNNIFIGKGVDMFGTGETSIISARYLTNITVTNCKSIGALDTDYFISTYNIGSILAIVEDNNFGNTLGSNDNVPIQKGFSKDIELYKNSVTLNAYNSPTTNFALKYTDASSGLISMNMEKTDSYGYTGAIAFNGKVEGYASTALQQLNSSYSAWGITANVKNYANGYMAIAHTKVDGTQELILKFTEAGNVEPGTTDMVDLGSVTKKFNNVFLNLPQADPLVVGQLWNNAGVVTVSAG